MRKIPEILHEFFMTMSKSSSAGEDHINTLFLWFLVLAAIILTIVIVTVFIGAIKYRSGKTSGEPEQVTGNKWLEITWTAVPLLVLIFFFYFTVKYMKDMSAPAKQPGAPDVVITGHQWWWEIQYPGYNFETAYELHMPAGQNFLARLGSADVIHDWWVPELGRKMDAIPGRADFMVLSSYHPGEYVGTCSEYCGAQHAGMRILVIVSTKEEYQAWIKNQEAVPPSPSDSLGLAGLKLFHTMTCGGCHSIAGTDANSHIGPDLTHVSTRKALGSGVIANTPGNLYMWIEDPQKIKNGVYMPNFHLSNDQIKALVQYLEDMK